MNECINLRFSVWVKLLRYRERNWQKQAHLHGELWMILASVIHKARLWIDLSWVYGSGTKLMRLSMVSGICWGFGSIHEWSTLLFFPVFHNNPKWVLKKRIIGREYGLNFFSRIYIYLCKVHSKIDWKIQKISCITLACPFWVPIMASCARTAHLFS